MMVISFVIGMPDMTRCQQPRHGASAAAPLSTVDGRPVGALRARMSGKLNARFHCPKLKGNASAPLAVMAYSQADKNVLLAAAADGGGDRAPALERRSIDHVNSPGQVLPFDLFVRQPLADATPYSPRGKASAIIDILARGDDVVNKNKKHYQFVFFLKRSRTYELREFPSPLR
jgi:hypothetical protein